MKNYLITGASSDIGMSLCRALAPNADLIVATANNGSESLSSLGEELTSKYTNLTFLTITVNLSIAENVEEMLSEFAEKGISFTHFVHLPSLRPINAKLKKFDFERFYTDFELQVGSALRISRHIMPTMAKEKYGRVLFMLTSYIDNPPKNMTSYVTVKSALAGLCKSLSVDFASFGVTVNGILPSMVETKFLQDTSNLIVEGAAEAHPMGRNATVEDIVPAMEFLLSDDAGYITGTMLSVNGGS